ncbi:hypothetical protein KY495_05485 [Massilia sp. PAMC28688]|uniref:hypothetical protein n=1 Tax=Massilia sp. PAMC28688 TaxID=2861283 RepID=UPI001C6351A0|nr:hypothetical protein [Massilia sp. PAMC28688]QYF94649.1 hypothetical protein KY495_05485 [Massilia sp. PAMC28688]
MPSQPDIVVYSPDRQLQLVVECKRMPNSDPRWAAELHRNLLEHKAVPPSPFFLLVLPDKLYLWSSKQKKASYLPDFQAETSSALRRYLPEQSIRGMTDLGLEMAVRIWLNDMTNTSVSTDQGTLQSWAVDSGLFDAIRRGTVETEAAA